MPSSLHLFDPQRHALPLPENFAALEAMRELLHARADGKNLRFVEFALRFEDRFKNAGRTTPLQQANACRRAAWQFDLPNVDEMPAYRAAVEIAGELGLVAYDAALGVGFLPDGRVVPTEFAQAAAHAAPAGKLPWGALPPDALRGESEVREVLAPALTRAMAASGFELEAAPPDEPGAPIVLARRIGAVRQVLTVNLMRYEVLNLTLRVWHDACTAVLAQAFGPKPHHDTAFQLDMAFFEPGPGSLHRWSLERLAQLPAVLALVCGRVAAVRAALAHTPPLARWSDVAAWRAALRPIPASLLSHTPDPRGRRCHHYEVTEALHQDLRKDPGGFWARFAGPDGASELSRIWREKAGTLPVADRIPPDGLGCHVVTLPGKAGEGAIAVVCLCFPPITGLDEHRFLALARRGDISRMFRMGYDNALDDDGQMQLRIEYATRHGNADVITRETLDAEMNMQAFLQRVTELFA